MPDPLRGADVDATETDEPAPSLTVDEKLDLIIEQQGQMGEQNNWLTEKIGYILTVIKTAEVAIANSPMGKMAGIKSRG